LRRQLCLAQDGQQDSDQNRDDGNDHKQFDQCKTGHSTFNGVSRHFAPQRRAPRVKTRWNRAAILAEAAVFYKQKPIQPLDDSCQRQLIFIPLHRTT
jgi:hypothetical protein